MVKGHFVIWLKKQHKDKLAPLKPHRRRYHHLSSCPARTGGYSWEERSDMSSISQGILMALTVTVNKYASSNVQAVHRKKKKRPTTATTTTSTTDFGRRGLFLSTVVSALQVSDSRTELLKKYLKKSEENKAKNDKERLDSYYRRNYKDYFELVEGTLKGKDGEISEAEKGIRDWLRSSK